MSEDLDSAVLAAKKRQLQQMLWTLREELDGYLASEYGIDHNSISKSEEYDARFARWQRSHQPFHWWVEFYGIIKKGGFDVSIGNPPYVEKSKFRQSGYTINGFLTGECSDIYAAVVERSLHLCRRRGSLGFIIPISIACADDFATLQELILMQDRPKWMAHFANRPSQLFSGAQKRLTVLLLGSSTSRSSLYTSRYKRWFKEERSDLLDTTEYTLQAGLPAVFKHSLAKIGSHLEISIVKKALESGQRLGKYTIGTSSFKAYYVRTPGYFCQFWDRPPMVKVLKTGEVRHRGELYSDAFKTEDDLYLCLSILNSSLFYWYIFAYSDCRHMNRRDVLYFPLNVALLDEDASQRLIRLSHELQEDFQRNKSTLLKSGLEIETFDATRSKPLIDEIDRVLARHFGFTDEELDFIINNDVKYRMRYSDEGDNEGE